MHAQLGYGLVIDLANLKPSTCPHSLEWSRASLKMYDLQKAYVAKKVSGNTLKH